MLFCLSRVAAGVRRKAMEIEQIIDHQPVDDGTSMWSFINIATTTREEKIKIRENWQRPDLSVPRWEL